MKRSAEEFEGVGEGVAVSRLLSSPKTMLRYVDHLFEKDLVLCRQKNIEVGELLDWVTSNQGNSWTKAPRDSRP